MNDAAIRNAHIHAGIISTTRTAVFAKVFADRPCAPVPLSADELARRGFHDAAAAKRARFDMNTIAYNGQYRRG